MVNLELGIEITVELFTPFASRIPTLDPPAATIADRCKPARVWRLQSNANNVKFDDTSSEKLILLPKVLASRDHV